MSLQTLKSIKDRFPSEYRQMNSVGIKKYKKHKIQIYHYVKEVYKWIIEAIQEDYDKAHDNESCHSS